MYGISKPLLLLWVAPAHGPHHAATFLRSASSWQLGVGTTSALQTAATHSQMQTLHVYFPQHTLPHRTVPQLILSLHPPHRTTTPYLTENTEPRLTDSASRATAALAA